MKCKIFYDEPAVAQAAFNEWADGKALGRDVLIHTHMLTVGTGLLDARLMIVVIHPDNDYWNSTKSKPIQRVQRQTDTKLGMECATVTA
jgi:hypothetical protein